MRHCRTIRRHHHRRHGARGRTSRVTAAQRRRAAETRARRAARKRRIAQTKRRTLASKLARDSVAELRRRQNERAVRDYMDMHYSYDSDDEYYPHEWQKRFNL